LKQAVTVFYRQPLAGVDEKTGQVLVQVSEKYFRPTEVQSVTQLPMMSDEGVMILESHYPKEQVLVFIFIGNELY